MSIDGYRHSLAFGRCPRMVESGQTGLRVVTLQPEG